MPNNTTVFQGHQRKSSQIYDGIVWHMPSWRKQLHGKVERKIRQTKELLEKSVLNQRLSVLQWETVGPEITNAINDLPSALGKLVSDF